MQKMRQSIKVKPGRGFGFLLIAALSAALVFSACGTEKPGGTPGPSGSSSTSESAAPTEERITESGEQETGSTELPETASAEPEPSSVTESETPSVTEPETTAAPVILPEGNDLESRFAVPAGYIRSAYPEGSFGSFVRHYPLKPDGSPVLLWDGRQKPDQSGHAAVFAMRVEDELDVQQCADSVMRIYAEYFRAAGLYDRIRFHFVSGFLFDYNTFIQGYRIQVAGSDVNWVLSKPPEDSDAVFNEYMKYVCAYASTLSMVGESEETDLADLKIGDIFLRGGSPGHVVMVADVCEKDGQKAFLLAQGYMPAQEFHVIRNPRHPDDPWYYEEEVQYPFRTQAYTFEEGSLRRPVY